MIKKNLKIIVTGSSGYIGGRIVLELKKGKINYLAIDIDEKSVGKHLALDLSSKKTLTTIEKFNPNVIIHCGTHSALAYKNSFVKSFTQDFTGLSNILSSLESRPNCRLVYFSSSYVYSGLSSKTVSEDSPLKPAHNFGVGKTFFEQYIMRNHQNSVIFRLSSVFGAGNSLNPNTISEFVTEGKSTGKITIWGKGYRKIQYVYLEDVVRLVIESFIIPPGVYNLGSDDYISVKEAAEKVAKALKKRVLFMRNKPEGETLPFLSNKKIKKNTKTGFTSFNTALKEYLKFYE